MLGPIKYGRLKQCHPRYSAAQLMKLKCLYKGGQHLLDNDAVMNDVFPRFVDESNTVYAERKKRAHYENLFALVVNQLSAGLAQDPCRLAHTDEAAEPGTAIKPDQFWIDLMHCATKKDDDGSEVRTWDQMMRDIAVEGLVCGWNWVQVDLPRPNPAVKTLKEQEDDGRLDAYVCFWPTHHVTDWEEVDGALLWLRTYECRVQSLTPDMPRDTKIHVWKIWDRTGWTTYRIVQNKDKALPNDDALIEPVAELSGDHSFKRVPWIRFDVDRGATYLHVGDLVESLCRSYFVRSCGEVWQWTQHYFQQLYEFLGPEMPGVDTPVADAQTDPHRAIRRRRGPGVVHERGKDDRAEFVGPNLAGSDIGRQSLQDLRDAILRVTQQLALTQDTSGAMLKRSADSKKQDAISQEILLGAIGKRVLTMANQLAALIATARGEEEAPELQGYARFNVTDADDLINQAVLVNTIDIPSATYQVEMKYQMAVTHLGDGISEDVKKLIRDELEQAITQDQIMMLKESETTVATEGAKAAQLANDNPEGEEDSGGKKKD